MPLDFYANEQRDALSDAATRIAPSLPATFSETFDESLRTGIEWGNAAAFYFAREHAVGDYVRGLRETTGVKDLPNPALVGNSLDAFNARLSQIASDQPELGLKYLSDKDMEEMGLARMAARRAESAAMARREHTFGGSAGGLVGGLVAGSVDPVNIALLPLGGYGAGVAVRAAEFAAIGAGGQLANELIAGGAREQAAPGYLESGEPVANVLMAGLSGGALGAGFGALGRLLGEGAKPLPTTARDALNGVTSEIQVAATNPFPGVAGEMAHRDGLAGAVGQVARGERVDVSRFVAPELVEDWRARVAQAADAGLVKDLGPLDARVGAELARPAFDVPTLSAAVPSARVAADLGDEIPGILMRGLPERPAPGGIRAFHGTPHDFERFDIARIGTGEGAQAFGHGLYFAENPSIARSYRDTLSDRLKALDYKIEGTDLRISNWIGQRAEALGGLQRAELKQGLAEIRAEIEGTIAFRERHGGEGAAEGLRRDLKALAAVEGGAKVVPPGHLYEVRIKADAGRFLDWDARLASLPDIPDDKVMTNWRGEEYWRYLKAALGPEAAVQRLRDEGFAGIKYLDASSRGRRDGQTRNLVVFDDNLVEIVAKNGQRLDPLSLSDFRRGEAAARLAEWERVSAEAKLRPLTIGERADVEFFPEPPRPALPAADIAAAEAALRADPALAAAGAKAFGAEAMAALRKDPALAEGALRDMDRIRLAKPDADVHFNVVDADGVARTEVRKVEDVLAELDAMAAAARELEGCVLGATVGAAA